ncbi:hypothetical protein GPECTOR_31g327 [Gonium pectorale]|uniref:Protein kinase domain-containing protein n=1 Tax=Gonium pectorale TaxID=33097 RepID=A0A150GEG1_GONPE|nr:hypothetical protein GPECTOR_31g327 [Gonium pectorale]|eukprot:KXZ47965.1 hypothetical protein GPECTOR_31g327 [Gonium pectorale]
MIGKGGFAAVFLGTYKGQEVAVKVILAEHVSEESVQVKLLLREGQYMSRVTHKNIVKCHAVCQLPADFPGIEAMGHRSSTWALVLEYIGGGSLASLLMRQMAQTRRAYSDYEAYCWVRDVAEALCYLHNAPRPALDGKNPMLRRRSMSPAEGLGRSSLRSGGSGVGPGPGLGRVSMSPSLAAPSVSTYYNDANHEPGKIFYLLDELPAVTVAALPQPGPSGSRRPSYSEAAADPAAAAAAGGASSGLTSPTAAAGLGAVSSRNASFDTAGGGGGLPWSGGSGRTPPVRSPYGSSNGMLAPPSLPPPGGLVPLNEEASYHGNTAGYAAMLQAQQQARRAAAAARAAAASSVAATTPAAPLGGSLGGGGGSGRLGTTQSLPGSTHGSAAGGASGRGSPYDSPAVSGRWQVDDAAVASGGVKLRIVGGDEAPGGSGTGSRAGSGAGTAAGTPVPGSSGTHHHLPGSGHENHHHHHTPPASAPPHAHPAAHHAHAHPRPNQLEPLKHSSGGVAGGGGGGDATIASAAASRLLGVPVVSSAAAATAAAHAVPVPGKDGSLVRMSVTTAAKALADPAAEVAAAEHGPHHSAPKKQDSSGSMNSGGGGGSTTNGHANGNSQNSNGHHHGNGNGHKSLGTMSVSALLQGRYEQDFQWVWRLTGQTGSCMYMAPEVFRNLPYNEKVDVFSFGVLLYEVFSRTLSLIAGLNLRELRLKGQDTPEGYAAYVADGYRPHRPQSMPEPLYELIAACWADDPLARPTMADVVDSLAALQEAFAPAAGGRGASVPACGCAIS